jgi:hypothetical protein
MARRRLDFAPPNVIEWLLEPEDPAVRYLTLTELLERSPRNREVKAARSDIMRCGAVPAILARQTPEGGWGKPDSFYTGKYRSTVWQLIILAEHGADGSSEPIRRACEHILAYSQDPSSGGFSQQRARRAGGGRPSEVIPCLTGNLVWSLLRFGYLGDPRVELGIKWLTRFLRFDDGESEPPADWPYARWEMCYGRHSCLMAVVKGLKALAEIPEEARSRAVRRTIQKAVEFILLHHVYRRSHNLAKAAKPGWTRFGFPRMYQTDVLEVTRLLVGLGVEDPRMREALELIESQREPDGRWLLKDTFNGSFLVDIEEKGQPSKWITLNALRTLEGAARAA